MLLLKWKLERLGNRMNTVYSRSLLIEELIEWLSSHLRLSGKSGYVLGVSGGVDSFVSAMVSYETCRRLNKRIRLLSLPIVEPSTLNEEGNVETVFKERGIDVSCIDLSNLYQEFKKICFSDLPATSWPTIKHRLRMTYIYTIAKRENLLVVGTVNGVEFNIGYFAKWSGLGDVLPLANLTKHQIREIARDLGCPEQIIEQRASGCVSGGYAEEEWGFTEDEADRLISNKKNTIRREAIVTFDEMVKESKHKRIFAPIFNPGL